MKKLLIDKRDIALRQHQRQHSIMQYEIDVPLRELVGKIVMTPSSASGADGPW